MEGNIVSEHLTQGLVLRDTWLDPHPEPCSDCGRTHLQGEHLALQVVTAVPGEYRVVWEGCVDCWLLRTNPGKVKD